jgi:hypothetical protein
MVEAFVAFSIIFVEFFEILLIYYKSRYGGIVFISYVVISRDEVAGSN